MSQNKKPVTNIKCSLHISIFRLLSDFAVTNRLEPTNIEKTEKNLVCHKNTPLKKKIERKEKTDILTSSKKFYIFFYILITYVYVYVYTVDY